MAVSFDLALTVGCRLVDADGPPRLETPAGSVPVEPALVAAVKLLAAGGVTEEQLAAQLATAGYAALQSLYRLLFTLHERCLLERQVASGERLLAGCRPLAAGCPFSRAAAGDGPFVLSRFALLRRRGDELVAETPLAAARVTLYHRAAAELLYALTTPRTVPQLAGGELPAAALRQLVELFAYAGLLSPVEPSGRPQEDADPELGRWEAHDLQFHARSRAGRHDHPWGATFRLRGRAEPLPALEPPREGETVELWRSDLERLTATDPPLTQVLEQRRSRRHHGEPPLSARELGELLYRSARAGPVTDGGEYEVARRPYPGGGGAWELEVYPLVSRCQGLEPGLYHYRPGEHRLARLAAATADLDRLLTGAARATHREAPPQLLLILAARFGRLSYKYSSMAYATVLKDVGVLMQTFYLVGTAMGLAVCAVGGGDSDRFAAASGLSYYAEGSVGELVVGRAAPGEDEA